MLKSRGLVACAASVVFLAGFSLGIVCRPRVVSAQGSGTVFELRTYTAPEGKLVDLQKRFRDHTRRIFDKHGMKSIGYWVPQDAPQSQNTLIYILAYPSREAADKARLRAGSGAATVDMESHVAARFAAAHSLPLAVLVSFARTISVL